MKLKGENFGGKRKWDVFLKNKEISDGAGPLNSGDFDNKLKEIVEDR